MDNYRYSGGLLKLIQRYDQEQETYISELQAQIKKLQEEKSELLTLCMQGEAAREKLLLTAITNGAFDRPSTLSDDRTRAERWREIWIDRYS